MNDLPSDISILMPSMVDAIRLVSDSAEDAESAVRISLAYAFPELILFQM